ncbi:hypothetical protein CTAYLR_006941 [Chrysophaeum taylorii]|uniref:Selenoprotein O n=1 Tax=Chrysophaeum taylorii TaxID=2483200 RepID=A0AAD7XIS5_9STRA|nr:hypothetical protein CTAYLR_006941 [Chrysophaeum taylorii]
MPPVYRRRSVVVITLLGLGARALRVPRLIARGWAVGGGSVVMGASTTTTAAAAEKSDVALDRFAQRADLSWLSQLSEDPEAKAYEPNRSSREVKSGHYVRVAPMALPGPELLLYSEELAGELELSQAVENPRFARFLSGDVEALDLGGTWATPYALSIMGEEMVHNCPFGTGNGYGDGRAVSIGEVVVEDRRYELQLKGGGQTPFCRGADGRAVLRSSLREFLASEAMHFLRVPTTRALSLVASRELRIRRPWYSNRAAPISESDPRLAHLPVELRRQLIRQSASNPDVAVEEPAAITCRVAPSFLRVGHLDLFARRAARDPARRPQHRAMVAHAIFREYRDLWTPTLVDDDEALRAAALEMTRRARANLAALAADWLRVGFCQGNFNADNCLVAGRTMDYGPFGFMDRYDPTFAKWVGSGAHFAFAAQPRAAQVNFGTLVKALLPLFVDDNKGRDDLRALVAGSDRVFREAVDSCYAAKLGFDLPSEATTRIWHRFEEILRDAALDYTIAFRELSAFDATRILDLARYRDDENDDEKESRLDTLAAWIKDWRAALADAGVDEDRAVATMNSNNPKYVLREWMLVRAYEAAYRGDASVARDLHRLIKRPYDDQPEFDEAYYRRADNADLSRPGTAFMT